ncbi:MAG: N-acetylneuraminate lyase [Pseudomonadota bacterium]
MVSLHGFFAAIPTPFSSDRKTIAADVLGGLVERNLGAGLAGLYVGGSTGEAFLMSTEERAQLLKLTAESAEGRGVLIAHVGDLNPAVSAHLARTAADAGYHAISAVPPFYYQYTIREIADHYHWLARQTDLPFLIYNFPALSGVRWSVDDLGNLLDIPQVVGVKNTCSDLYAFEQLRNLRPDAALLHGFDETLVAGLTMGADGGIGSSYNLQASRILALAAALERGDTKQAQQHQMEANRLIDALVSTSVIPGLKYMLGRAGLAMGPCRSPFHPLSDDQRRTLDTAMDLLPPSGLSQGQTRPTAMG